METPRELERKVTSAILGWSRKRFAGIFIFNVALMLLVLLRTAGYFDPFFPITINLIFLASTVMSVILLGFTGRGVFVLAIIFWVVAMFFRILAINIWAERAAIYTFQALSVGAFLLIIENVKKDGKHAE